jgi:AcrR family transcriptional regulator
MDVSFRELESFLFGKLQQLFAQTMQEVLEQLDAMLLVSRDQARYEVKDVRERAMDTLLGAVTFKRRYYRDRENGDYVALLEQKLGLEKGERVSPGLAVAAVMQAVLGPSYRAASETLSSFFGHPVLSHESVRQLMLEVGKTIQQQESVARNRGEGKRWVPLLLVEADGYWVSMQRDQKSRREVRVMVAHEGWRPRTPGSSEFELVERTYYGDLSGQDFWEEASRQLYSRYDIDERTLVVINGDRAGWIRKGSEYFPRAWYQADRFHIKRDLKQWLQGDPELGAALAAFDANAPAQLQAVLRRAADRTDPRRATELLELCRDIGRIPDSFRDYRVRLQELGQEVQGLRGLGAMESNVDRFANRMKKRGQSWGLAGALSMLNGLIQRFEGKLAAYAEHVGRLRDLVSEERLRAGAGHLVQQAVSVAIGVKQSHPPILGAGRIRSGGMSRVVRSINRVQMSVT